MSVTGSKTALDVSLIGQLNKLLKFSMAIQVMIPYTYFISTFQAFLFQVL